jgi:predicted DsbA family dithiol-disulfide isomerase
VSTNGHPISVDFYFDFLCPWAFRASEWIRDVQEQLGPDKLKVNWRYFPLEQVNSEEGPEWKLWEQPDEHSSRGMEMFRGALAAWQQDKGEKFDKFHQLVFRTRHGEHTVNGDRPSVHDIAESVGFDMERFHKDFADRSLLSRIGEDYEYAREKLGVFGVPTLVFEDDRAAYIKLMPKPSKDEAVAVWNEVSPLIADRPLIHEIKRPTPPSS